MNVDAMAVGPAGDISLHVPGGAGLGAIARLRADGTPDPSFGENGYSYMALPEGDGRSFNMSLHEGKIYSVGSGGPGFELLSVSLRVSADGSLDTSFHAPAGYEYYTPEGGTVIVAAYMYGSHIAVDGSFYSCGHSFADPSETSPYGDYNYLLLRYTPDGERDPAFGQGGVVSLDHVGAAGPFPLPDNFCVNVGTAADGKVAFGGDAASLLFNGLSNFVVGRLLPDGRPDPSFGNQGIVEIDVGPSETMTDFVVLPDGRMVGAGFSGLNELNPVVIVVRPDGTLDPNFGEGGVLRFPGENAGNSPVLLEVQPDGKVLVAATTITEGSFVARLIVP
ncbi:MAG: hypothetical protein MUF34_32715 [Polyangiaceae bacterium]|jgi:uncharacterized delta-60 repeat protein|nr:hypothetical protein [Polyangiaceae bacterium]